MIPLKSDFGRGALGAVLLVLSACSTLPVGVADSSCRQRFEALDEHIEDAGVRDGGETRIEGFPYLRVNRFLASFRDEAVDGPAFDAWVRHLRELDRRARRAELRNLGMDVALDALDQCGDLLLRQEFTDAETRALLRERATVPDDYSGTARFLGAYYLAAPFLKSGVREYQDGVRSQYAAPLKTDAARVRWQSAVKSVGKGWSPTYNALGIPLLSEEQWQVLAVRHAPEFSVETRGPYDRPGVPILSEDGPAFDATRPVVHVQPSYTRFGARVLAQLSYVIWFSERPHQSFYDPYAGFLDGVIWRVTLDEQGQPLVYDTVHACGCYHYYFPVQSLNRRENADDDQETALLPQVGLAPVRPSVLLQSATHYVERVQPATVDVSANRYELRPYSDLLSLDAGDSQRRSLFAEDGLVEGSERGERQWLWMSGIASPGAMRQWGRHATAFVGRAHFDDARALEAVFVP